MSPQFETTDRIASAFQKYLSQVYDGPRPADQERELRRAFIAGAFMVFVNVTQVAVNISESKGDESAEAFLRAMEADILAEFGKELVPNLNTQPPESAPANEDDPPNQETRSE